MSASGGARGSGGFRDEAEQAELVERRTVYRGYVWDVVSESFRYRQEVLRREFVAHTGAVAVLALDEQERALFIQQYRHPVRMREWELPAGLLDQPGEDALEAAKRELAEEADLEAGEWRVLQDFFTTPGGNDESIRIYLAREVRPTAQSFPREHEEADIVTRWVPLDDAVAAARRGELHNPSAVIGVYAAAASRAVGWADLQPADAPWPTRSPRGARG